MQWNARAGVTFAVLEYIHMRLTHDGEVSLVVDATEFVLSHTEVSAGVFKLGRQNPVCIFAKI